MPAIKPSKPCLASASFRPSVLRAAERAAALDDVALGLGCLWGQAVCDLLGWEWASVRLGPEWQDYGVVPPGRSHVIFPVRYVRGLLADPGRDRTSLLLYNMLRAGSLPPSDKGFHKMGPDKTCAAGDEIVGH